MTVWIFKISALMAVWLSGFLTASKRDEGFGIAAFLFLLVGVVGLCG